MEAVHHTVKRKALPVAPRHVRTGHWFQRRSRRAVHGWWTWELIAAAVSVTAMIALIAVLADADKNPQQSWNVGSTDLTLNTVVAAIGTIIRSSLLLAVAGALNQSAWNWFASKTGDVETEGQPLVDLETFSEAAANSWNSLKLLWRTKGRYIASIGALITILSLASDTFVQQVLTINIQPREVKLSTNFTVSNLLPNTYSYSDSGLEGGGQTGTLRWQSLITSGVIKSNTTLPTAECPTGKCTWPVTPTIGICNECRKVDATVTTSSNSSCDSVITYTLPPLSGFDISLPGVTNSSLEMSTCGNRKNSNWTLNTESWPFDMDSLDRGRNTTIANFYSFGMAPTAVDEGSETDFTAYKCSFYFCVQGYSATSSSGKTSQRLVSAVADKARLDIDDNGNYWWAFYDLPEELNAAPNTIYRVTEQLRSMAGYNAFAEVLTGSVLSSIGETLSTSTIPTNPIAFLMWEASGSLTNLTAMAESISDTVTTFIRTSGKSPIFDTRFAPTVEVSVSVVGVRWAWLTYPLTLLVAGLIFLGITISATHRRRVRPWKGHRVPLLLAELDEDVRSQAKGGLSHRTGVEERVGAVRVRLEFDGDDGIAFRRVLPAIAMMTVAGTPKSSQGTSLLEQGRGNGGTDQSHGYAPR